MIFDFHNETLKKLKFKKIQKKIYKKFELKKYNSKT